MTEKSTKENKLSRAKKIAYISSFGALCGLVEVTIGSYLHALHIPFTGLIMGSIMIIIILTGCFVIREKGSALSIGLIAAFLKLFSIGSVVLSPLIAIVSQALIAEILVSLIGINITGFIITAGMTVLFNFFYPFFSQTVLMGSDVLKVYKGIIEQGSQFFSLPVELAWLILGFLIIIYFGAGMCAGAVAWKLSHQINQKLGF